MPGIKRRRGDRRSADGRQTTAKRRAAASGANNGIPIENKYQSLLFAKCFQAYAECSDSIQAAVREMTEIVLDPKSDDDEREMALATIAETLFPETIAPDGGIDLEELDRLEARASQEGRAVHRKLDREEAVFAARLRQFMKEKGVTQAELAERIGVGQPAISMMLNRQCRPQPRTIERLAKALGVSIKDLWRPL
jgi:DNA-binding XRE family transcriptional regulator